MSIKDLTDSKRMRNKKAVKVPHSICALATVKMLRVRLMALPRENWNFFLYRVEQNINRKWARSLK